jgi:hypothetical protein
VRAKQQCCAEQLFPEKLTDNGEFQTNSRSTHRPLKKKAAYKPIKNKDLMVLRQVVDNIFSVKGNLPLPRLLMDGKMAYFRHTPANE